jgi:peptidoglycan/xylan/chitin deacetylase (PgdA/CDA1 family)
MVILNLHGVGPVTREIKDEERDCWIKSDFLKSILDLVTQYQNIGLTVDDGNKSDIEILLPELLKRELTCTFFICSARLKLRSFINESDIKYIHGAGMKIGSHGKHHQNWRGLDALTLSEEIMDSRKVLESITGETIDTIACPFGSYDKTSLKFIKSVGFKKVYTSDPGHCRSTDWLSRRNTIKRNMTIDNVQRIIEDQSTIIERTKLSLKTLIKRLR